MEDKARHVSRAQKTSLYTATNSIKLFGAVKTCCLNYESAYELVKMTAIGWIGESLPIGHNKHILSSKYKHIL